MLRATRSRPRVDHFHFKVDFSDDDFRLWDLDCFGFPVVPAGP
jgi:hypothetical protein